MGLFAPRTGQQWTRPAAGAAIPRQTYEKTVYRDDLECRLYWVYVLDPRDGFQSVTLGYIGETSRADLSDPYGPRHPLIRFQEHAGILKPPGQPWSDTIPELDPVLAMRRGLFVVGDEVYPDKAAAYVAEQAAIRWHRPLYNDEYNRNNPDRITIYEARGQRAARDARAGLPLEQTWAHQHDLAELAKLQEPAAVLSAAGLYGWWGRLWRSPRNQQRLGMLLLWLVPTLVLWWLADRYAPVVSVWRLGGVVGAAVALGLLWAVNRRRRRRRLVVRAARWSLTLFGLWLLVWPALERAAAFLEHARR